MSEIANTGLIPPTIRKISYYCNGCLSIVEAPHACAPNIPPSSVGGILGVSGVKHDQEKADFSLLSTIALQKTAQVMTFGKKKYAAHNWRGGLAWGRVLAAAGRHLYAYIGGEDKDPETGFSHLAHCACCIMFLLEYEETHKELDDRYKK